MRIAIIGGCGRLGLSIAAVSVKCGHDVICVDVNKQAVDMVNLGQCPISENGVAELVSDGRLGKLKGSLFATVDYEYTLGHSELVLIVVPTPSEESGRFSLKYVLQACEEIAAYMSDYKTICLVSTVMPRDCAGVIVPFLEDKSGKRAGVDFGFSYSPEFIRQGSIMHDFCNPDMVLIGQHDQQAGDDVWRYYSSILENIPAIHRMNLVNAEITKIGLNTALVAKLAMANQITWLCHKTRGADAEKVLGAIGADGRMGHRFFKPGLPPGGPCLPRDARAFFEATEDACSHSQWGFDLSVAWVYEIENLKRALWGLHDDGGLIAVLGMTYKTGVDIEEESAGKRLLKSLRAELPDRELVAFDPVIDSMEAFLHIVDMSNLLVITTPHEQFKQLEEMNLSGKIIFDCWGLLDESKLDCEEYIRLGRGK